MLTILRRTMSEQSKVITAWNQFLSRQLSDLNLQPNPASASSSLKDNPFYKKYADKLKAANPASVNSSTNEKLSEEQKQVATKIEQLNQKLEPDQLSNDDSTKKTKKPETSKTRQTPSFVKTRTLNDVVKVELLKKHSKSEIEQIWCDYFRNKIDCLFACIDPQTYQIQRCNAQRYPLFVFPLPVQPESSRALDNQADQPNYEIVLAQFHEDQVYFTPLIMYQQYGENAPPCLVVHHFTELSESNGIVLMEGEFDKQIFSCSQAQCLVNQLQIFYATLNARRIELLHGFNMNPSDFDYKDIIKEFENLSTKPSN